MNHSVKFERVNRIRNRNNQLQFSTGTCIDVLPLQAFANSVQPHSNSKHVYHTGEMNEISEIKYNRTSNFQIRNIQDMNGFQNMSLPQQQNTFNSPHHNYFNSNFYQKSQVNQTIQSKRLRERQICTEKCSSNTIESNRSAGFYGKHTITLSIKKKKYENRQQKQHDIKSHQPYSPDMASMESKSNNCYKKRPITSRTQQPNQFDLSKEGKTENPEFLNITNNEDNQNENKTILAEEKGMKPNETNVCSQHTSHDKNDVEPGTNIDNTDSVPTSEEEFNKNSTKCPREKTPMCLINDLARYNKVSFQYRLTSENGPAHCKRFTVTLKLGDEEYTAEGFKIKKAQHLAAKEAIEKTKYKHPTPKSSRRNDDNAVKSNITPTVELNALAMKLGQQTYYTFDHRAMSSSASISQNISHTNIVTYGQTFNLTKTSQELDLTNNSKQIQIIQPNRQILSKFPPRYPIFLHPNPNNLVPDRHWEITLMVGSQKFSGIGRTPQQAKHNAAANALKVLKEQMNNNQIETQNEISVENSNKSPISLVFEIGIKRNLPVDFKVLREEGPAHMRTFTTACIVGNIITEGEGTGKKVSKNKAAQKMLEELNKLPPLTPNATSPQKRAKSKTSPKKRANTPIKSSKFTESKEDPQRQRNKYKKIITETDSNNPIVQLLEWHQNNKEQELVFKLINEFGKENSRRRQFVMEVSCNKFVARGVGNSKKLAKRDAAQNFLMVINGNNNNQTALPKESANISKGEKVLNNDKKCPPSDKVLNNEELNIINSEVKESTMTNVYNATPSDEKKNCGLLDNVPSKEVSTSTSIANASPKSQNLHMKDQLLYLAKLLGFEVDFSDYPKGNHNEFLTIVMLSTNPPQICHGIGVNAKESQEDAAKNALKILSEMGLNN